jgi:hypothetical protein
LTTVCPVSADADSGSQILSTALGSLVAYVLSFTLAGFEGGTGGDGPGRLPHHPSKSSNSLTIFCNSSPRSPTRLSCRASIEALAQQSRVVELQLVSNLDQTRIRTSFPPQISFFVRGEHTRYSTVPQSIIPNYLTAGLKSASHSEDHFPFFLGRKASCNPTSQASCALKHRKSSSLKLEKLCDTDFLRFWRGPRPGNVCLHHATNRRGHGTIYLAIDQNVRMFVTTVVC